MVTKLSKITKINPREIWKHEALDFTKWLAQEENLSILCEELELNLSNIQSEAAAGRYNVDIVADDLDTKRKVIIENQLASTDHKHLGQILTYASAFDAAIIIWVVTDYNEEHQQAIDWFNRNISDSISFFLIQIEVYKIGDSQPAPKFNIICEPNNWGKVIKSSNSGDSISELKLIQQEFWEGLKEYAYKKKTKASFTHTPKPRHWYNISIGTSKCHIALTINSTKQYIGCELYVHNKKEIFDNLYQQKEIIEKEIGEKLDWMELPDASASRVIIKLTGNPRDKSLWPKYFEWCIQKAEIFTTVFSKHLK